MKSLMLIMAGVVRYIRKWVQPKHGKFEVSLIKRLSVFFYGFMPDNAIFYDFKKYNRKDYLTDWQMYTRAILINKGYTELINNKLVFTHFMESVLNMAPTRGYFMNGKVVSLGDVNHGVTQNPLSFFEENLEEGKAFMIKKFDAGSGEGIYKISRTSSGFMWNEERFDEDILNSKLKKLNNYMISEVVQQAKYASDIFDKTANTVKFITMIDPDTQESFLAACFHRFGTERSIPVDNIGKGACVARVNVENGFMDPVYLVRDRKLHWITNHPDTGAKIAGITIPRFEEIRDKILETHNSIKYIKYITWDVVIQDDGFVLLECNANTDMAGIQPFGPFLANSKVRKFYKYHNVI